MGSLHDHTMSDLRATDPNTFMKVNAFPAVQKGYFADTALAYDLATDLADKTPLTPILVCPEQPLSGSGLYAFASFLVDGMRERDYTQGVFDAYQSWKAVATTQHDFFIAPDAPGRPASPAELFAGFEAQYNRHRVSHRPGGQGDWRTKPSRIRQRRGR